MCVCAQEREKNSTVRVIIHPKEKFSGTSCN